MEHVMLLVLDGNEEVVGYDVLCDQATVDALNEYMRADEAEQE